MKIDIIFFVILLLFGIIAGEVFLNSVDQVIARKQDPVIQALGESLAYQKHLQAQIDVIDKRLENIEKVKGS